MDALLIVLAVTSVIVLLRRHLGHVRLPWLLVILFLVGGMAGNLLFCFLQPFGIFDRLLIRAPVIRFLMIVTGGILMVKEFGLALIGFFLRYRGEQDRHDDARR